MKVDNTVLLGAHSTFLVHDYLNLPYLLPAALQGGVSACLDAGLAASVYRAASLHKNIQKTDKNWTLELFRLHKDPCGTQDSKSCRVELMCLRHCKAHDPERIRFYLIVLL